MLPTLSRGTVSKISSRCDMYEQKDVKLLTLSFIHGTWIHHTLYLKSHLTFLMLLLVVEKIEVLRWTTIDNRSLFKHLILIFFVKHGEKIWPLFLSTNLIIFYTHTNIYFNQVYYLKKQQTKIKHQSITTFAV